MAEKPDQPRSDQTSRLAERLNYNNPRVFRARDHPQASSYDAGRVHTVRDDTQKAKCKEDAQQTVNTLQQSMNQKTAADCERDQVAIREAII